MAQLSGEELRRLVGETVETPEAAKIEAARTAPDGHPITASRVGDVTVRAVDEWEGRNEG
jgi:hypothetical protein